MHEKGEGEMRYFNILLVWFGWFVQNQLKSLQWRKQGFPYRFGFEYKEEGFICFKEGASAFSLPIASMNNDFID